MINLEEGAPEFLSGCNPMSIIQKRIRFGSLLTAVMLTLYVFSGTLIAYAQDEIALSPEGDSSTYMGCVTVDGNVSQDYADTVVLELENAATGERTELLLEWPYDTSLWLPEGNYTVCCTLSGDHFEIQYPREITVSRYEAFSLPLTITPGEISLLVEKQSSFVPKLPVPYAWQQQIWNYLLEITNNAYAAAGLMGNLYAESGLSPTNLQDACEASLGYEDGTYTEAVDSGTYSDFATDWAGYGLARGSASMSRTFFPCFARATPRLTQVVVLPTPPFWLTMAMIWVFILSSPFGFFQKHGCKTMFCIESPMMNCIFEASQFIIFSFLPPALWAALSVGARNRDIP